MKIGTPRISNFILTGAGGLLVLGLVVAWMHNVPRHVTPIDVRFLSAMLTENGSGSLLSLPPPEHSKRR